MAGPAVAPPWAGLPESPAASALAHTCQVGAVGGLACQPRASPCAHAHECVRKQPILGPALCLVHPRPSVDHLCGGSTQVLVCCRCAVTGGRRSGVQSHQHTRWGGEGTAAQGWALSPVCASAGVWQVWPAQRPTVCVRPGVDTPLPSGLPGLCQSLIRSCRWGASPKCVVPSSWSLAPHHSWGASGVSGSRDAFRGVCPGDPCASLRQPGAPCPFRQCLSFSIWVGMALPGGHLVGGSLLCSPDTSLTCCKASGDRHPPVELQCCRGGRARGGVA